VSKDVIRVPMITASGYTYEKDSLTRAIIYYGKDPLTNEPMDRRQAFPNNNLADAVADWLKFSGYEVEDDD